jgi:PAS domain S-box-containing protein
MNPKPSYEDLERKLKALEENVKRREQFLIDILNYIPDLVFVKDAEHRWVLLNDAFCTALGHSREDLIGKTDYDFHPQEEADVFWEKDNLVFQTGGVNVNEEVFTDPNGDLRTILTSKAAFRDEQGQPFLVGVAHDITQRKRAEHALADSERRLSDIIEFLPDPTWVIDLHGRVIAWNKAVERMTGAAKNDILGTGNYAHAVPFYGERRPTLIDLVLHRDRRWEEQYLRLQEKEGILLVADSFNPHMGRDGRYLSATAAKLYDANGNVAGAIQSVRDITELKRSEKERERLIAELQDALAKVRTLSGLLPICAACKKIRDDQGYWSQIESYISKHSKAEFSHSLCPDCARKLYPGLKITRD